MNLSDLEIINQIGMLSKRNLKFINNLKKNDIQFENYKKASKNVVKVNSCTIVYDYSNLEIKTKGDCDKFEEYI